VIEPARTTGTIPLSDLMKVRYASGRLSLPSSQSYFVRFEHVSGIPSGNRGEGYSIVKLRILDTLIDRLSSLRNHSGDKKNTGALSEKALDAMIENLQKQLHDSLKKAGATPFGTALGAGAAENGRILNVSA